MVLPERTAPSHRLIRAVASAIEPACAADRRGRHRRSSTPTMHDMHGDGIERATPSTAELVSALVRGTVSSLVPGGGLLAEALGLLVITADRMDRARETAQAAADEAGGIDVLVDRLHLDEYIQVLTLEGLELAARTADARKRRLAGKVIGRAARDSAMIDVAHLVTRALRGLDAPHLHALVQIRAIEVAHAPDESRTFPEVVLQDKDPGERQRRAMDEVRSYTLSLPDPVRAVLLGEGVVREGTSLGDMPIPTLFTSRFGRELLVELEAEVL